MKSHSSKTNRGGRGLTFKRNPHVNPPADTTWSWETREMLESPAYIARSINARRLWDALRLEHLINGAFMNGELVMPYNQLERVHGCSRALIRDAIDELIALGFLAMGEPAEINGNHRPASTYRLTFMGTGTSPELYAPPTNEWKRFKDTSREFAKLVKRDAKERRHRERELRRKQTAELADFRSAALQDVESASRVVELATTRRRRMPPVT